MQMIFDEIELIIYSKSLNCIYIFIETESNLHMQSS